MVNVNGYAVVLFSQPHRVLDNRQGPQPQKIHFEKSQLLDGCHGKLGGDGAVRGPGQRHKLVNGPAANHYPGRMHGCMPGQSLQTPGHVDEIMDLFILIVCLLKIRIHGQSLIQRHPQIPRDHLGNGVAQGIGQIQHTPHIADNTLGRQGTEGDNLHHLVLAVFAHHVVNYLLAPLITKVNINIRHGHALRVQETLKEKIITHRINIGDSQCVAYNASGGGTPPRPHDNVLGTGIVDKIPHYQEIIHVSHGADNIQLIVQPAAQCAVIIRVTSLKALTAQMV